MCWVLLFPSSLAVFVFSSPLYINIVEVKYYRNRLFTLSTQLMYNNMNRWCVSFSFFQCSCLEKKMFLLWVITILSSGTELRFLRDHLYYKGSLCTSSVLGGTFQLPNQKKIYGFWRKKKKKKGGSVWVLPGLFKKTKIIYESKINIPFCLKQRESWSILLYFSDCSLKYIWPSHGVCVRGIVFLKAK